jgi:hypothetical protein
MDDEEDKWIEQFLVILRRLYQILGGDPAKVGNEPNWAMNLVTQYYQQHGVPTNLTSQQISEALSDISTMQTMLQSPPSSVTPGSFSQVLADIASHLQ